MHIPNNIHRTFAMTAFIFHKAKTIIGVGDAILILFSITLKEQIFRLTRKTLCLPKDH